MRPPETGSSLPPDPRPWRAAWAILLAMGSAWLADSVHPGGFTFFAGGVSPALAYSILVVILCRREGIPGVLLALAFLWGAVVAAPFAARVNDSTTSAIQGWFGPTVGAWATPRFAAPLTEEILKVAIVPLLLRWPGLRFEGLRAGMALGALSGLGFTATENANDLVLAAIRAGWPGFLQAIYVRGLVAGIKHGVFGAICGAGAAGALAATTRIRGGIVFALALLAGAATHALWNGIAAPLLADVRCDPSAPDGPCASVADAATLALRVPTITALALAPGLLVLFFLAQGTRSDIAGR